MAAHDYVRQNCGIAGYVAEFIVGHWLHHLENYANQDKFSHYHMVMGTDCRNTTSGYCRDKIEFLRQREFSAGSR